MIGLELAKYLATIQAVIEPLQQAGIGTKICQDRAPQKWQLPYVIIQEIYTTPEYHLSGEIETLKSVVQVDVYASTRKETHEISEAIRLAPLSGYEGGTWNETVVKAVLIENERPIATQPVDGGDQWTFRKSVDYRITYEREVN